MHNSGNDPLSDYGFTHVTLEYLVENTVHEVFLLFEEFFTITIVFRFVISIHIHG